MSDSDSGKEDLEELKWRMERARRYIKSAVAKSGERGHDQTYKVAIYLSHGFLLDKGSAWQVFSEWNKTNCSPSWSEAELRRKLDEGSNADLMAHQKPGWLLTRDDAESILADRRNSSFAQLASQARPLGEAPKWDGGLVVAKPTKDPEVHPGGLVRRKKLSRDEVQGM